MSRCTRRLTFCAGHRILGHEGKCAQPHGHNYVAEITCEARVDVLGRVIDFGVIKELVGGWIERTWDHKFLVNMDDHELVDAFETLPTNCVYHMLGNPTAENIAHTLFAVSQELLKPQDVTVAKVRIHETENCWAECTE